MIKNISITHTDSSGDSIMADHGTDDNGRPVLRLDAAQAVYFTAGEWRAFKERVDGLFEPRDYPSGRRSDYDDEAPF